MRHSCPKISKPSRQERSDYRLGGGDHATIIVASTSLLVCLYGFGGGPGWKSRSLFFPFPFPTRVPATTQSSYAEWIDCAATKAR